ncbi:MAG: hypothetical protein FJ240_05145 [Nitrospira sp.]|nr:hypothetical protein [Nitrospira sp.]
MNKNRPKIGSNITVEPIRSLQDIKRIKTLLAENPRDFAIFVLGINTNLRANDIIKITVGQVKHLVAGDNLILREEKTDEIRRITINKAAYEAIQNLLSAIQDKKDDAPLFQSRKGHKPLGISHLNHLVKKWCSAIRLKGNYGGPTLRKTFGYIQFIHFKTDILTLMENV